MAFIAAALLASCSDDKDYSGDFGQIKVPDTRQLEQTVSADDTQSARGVTFTTEGAWTSTIAETRAEAPVWISISPDRGDAAGSYTLKITLEPNTSGASRTATIVITCGTSKIEITVTQEGADDPIESTPANRIRPAASHTTMPDASRVTNGTTARKTRPTPWMRSSGSAIPTPRP